ncbi:bacillithiol biosynthesis deacetylase BshB2 [Paenalkalicoccus suaedae]|uniref:Bacillithiol biosynthesis deacetylase BshB2 n=1 Tax=Paenalkalicoccus suaedae TaxID=2592382 RepID=A0A859FIC7_9BACI|nr:bacillithiol biosynthesis deacetylase BshB2 [Paenalkalicoccus suaedae]QKS72871.1 bacillithiol biosynthesis deacetylase BshB2 [Paenalkalicoccus suaedae]
MEESHVLVVFPHPDDEAFGVAGTIMKHTDNGTPVTYVCLTLGEMGRNMGRPVMATRESLPLIRREELDEACRLLGITDLRRFGMRDKTVEFADQDALADRIGDVINELKPSLVITFYPGYAVHPDHDATGACVIEAVRRMNPEDRPTIHAIAFANGSEEAIGEADVVRDVRDYSDRKMEVIAAHASQTAGLMEQIKNRVEKLDDTLAEQLSNERFWTYTIEDK